jgi:hypothetical protein
MMITDPGSATGFLSLNTLWWVVAAIAIFSSVIAFRRWYHHKAKPRLTRWGAGVDVLVGREGSVDEATGQKLPAIAPLGMALAQMRVDINEQGKALSDLTSMVAQVADQQMQIQNLDTRLTAVERHEGERIATKLESAAMLQAVAKRDSDVIDPQVDP